MQSVNGTWVPRAIAIGLLLLAGCGEKQPAKETPGPALAVQTDQLVVARVNDAPIYASCVTDHQAETGSTFAEAVEVCIEFELLAQAAARFRTDEEVLRAEKRESVRLFVEKEFAPTVDDPNDVPEAFLRQRVWPKRAVQAEFNHGELRSWSHGLAKASKKASPETHKAARSLAQAWAAEFRQKTGIKHKDFKAAVSRLGEDQAQTPKAKWVVEKSTGRRLQTKKGTVSSFSEALFEMENKGTTSGVVKTRFGYHVILLRKIRAPRKNSFTEALPEMRKGIYPKWRKLAFKNWAKVQLKTSEVKVTRKANIDGLLESVQIDVGSVAVGPAGAGETESK